MEKEIIPLRAKLSYMVGIRSDRMRYIRNGVTVCHGWYVFLGFYWFCFAFFRRFPIEFQHRYATGCFVSWKPNPKTRAGDLMWLKHKKYLRFDYMEDVRHAA